ncbi:uncharacterized protein LOC120183565 [Hibiscus syriacus]|uniref:uncharacterized protein LOC120183565 n=1 Tax=Hibiscus syriacus TaxID=106335 RepID=UPI001924D34E|nr:uncharacterized protein LOC120183565 [Hibiscus syriacus]
MQATAGAAVSSGYVQSNDPKPSTSISDRARDESPPVPKPDSEPGPSASVVKTSVPLLVCRGVVTGGKFKLTVYYEHDGEESDVNVNGGGADCNEWWGSWEGVLKLRNGGGGVSASTDVRLLIT